MNVTHLCQPTESAPKPKQQRVVRQLEILALRSLQLADRVVTGQLPFIKVITSADVVQATAFANVRAPT
jgi:hypothetical protein